MQKQRYLVSGMTCAACAARVEKAVAAVPGVKKVEVNLIMGRMTVWGGDALQSQAVVAAVEKSGYGAQRADEKTAPLPALAPEAEQAAIKKRVIWSVVFLLPLFYLSMGHMMGLPIPAFLSGHANMGGYAFAQFLLCLPIAIINGGYFRRGFAALWHRSPNMDSLIAVGSAAALAYSIYSIFCIDAALGAGDLSAAHGYAMDLYFESAGMILTLVTLGKFLEKRSEGKTSDAISRLIRLAPKTATVERHGKEQEISVDQIQKGDIIIIRPGQTLPVDGTVVSGESSINESALTGESMPVWKQPGDAVLSGTINGSGSFRFRAERVGEDTTLSEIIRLVEEASSSKAPISRFADRVSGVFVPIVMGIALLAFLVWLATGAGFAFSISIGIAVLVVSCPCALGLATPTAIMVGTGKGAEHGILFKSAAALETLHHVTAVVLDKTGTITEGRPKVTDVLLFAGEKQDFLAIADALEYASEHPLAQAVVQYVGAESRPKVTDFLAEHGKGVRGKIAGRQYFLGNAGYLSQQGLLSPAAKEKGDALAKEGKTILYLADSEKTWGLLAVADPIRKESKAAISALQSQGIEVHLLTGDTQLAADAVARQTGVNQAKGGALPGEKEAWIRALQEKGKKVAMIGDGINDAPALMRADVGLAIGAGADIAMESADVVLMKSSILDGVSAISLSKAVLRTIKQGLFWALVYNTLGIPLAAGVFYGLLEWKLNPEFAALAMSLSSICVVTNALRLKLWKPKLQKEKESKPKNNPNMKEERMMKKELIIEGMACGHCAGRVETALSALAGVKEATVQLEEKKAIVSMAQEISDAQLKEAVEAQGYQVVAIHAC